MKCHKCNYKWESRIKHPKSCPRCKVRLDYIPRSINNNHGGNN